MSNLFLTLVIAFVVIVIAIACLAVGWLITGKTKIERGSCGRAPGAKREEEEGCGTTTSCHICHPDAEKPKPTYRSDEKDT